MVHAKPVAVPFKSDAKPKYHPEVAGPEIKYSGEVPKVKLRRENDAIPANLHGNTVASVCPRMILTVQRVDHIASCAGDYYGVPRA